MANKIAALGTQVMKVTKPALENFWYYAKVELTPPKITDIPVVIGGFTSLIKSFKSGAWKQVTVKEAVINSMITTEVIMWFYIGECIGKGRLVGYKV